MENLVIDDAGVRIVDGTVTTDQELGNLRSFELSARREEFAELDVRLKDVGNTLGGVEPSNLDNISTAGPPELVHLLLDTHAPELAHVELRVPDAELLVQSIEPIGGGTKESQSLDGDIVRHEVADGVTDEDVGMLDVVPEVLPDFLLRRPFLVDEITADLDMRTVDDREVWAGLFDQRDQARHLGII